MKGRTPRMMRILSVAVALLCAGTVAACGSSSGGTTTTDSAASGGGSGTTTTATTHTVTHTATATATAKGSTTPTTGTGTTTGPTATTTTSGGSTGAAACRAADLALSYLGGEGATGHGELGFALRNTSHATCHTYGFPGVRLLDASGHPLPTTPTRSTNDFFGSAPEKGIDVAPGDTVSFRLGVSHVGSGGGESGCTTVHAVQVIAPNDTATMHVTIPGAYACPPVTVSPVQPGTSAFQH